jgi:hypothetical protein
MHIYYTFFRFLHLYVSVLGDHPQGANCYRVHQCYHVQTPRYKYPDFAHDSINVFCKVSTLRMVT